MATYLPEQWSKKATITYRSNTVLAERMDRRWQPELGIGRGDTVNIPNFTQNDSAQKRSAFGVGASLTFDAVTESQTQLIVDQMAYKAFRWPVEMSVQKMDIYEPLLTEGIGKAIGLQVDSELAGDNTNGIDALTAIGTDNQDITEQVILDAETVLNNANAPLEGRTFVISPASRASVLAIESVRNSLYAPALGSIDADKGPGFIGHYLTFDFLMTNNLEAGASGKKNGAFQTECIAFVMQKEVTMLKQTNIADGLFEEFVGFAVYGFKLVKSSFGREVDGK